MTNHTALIQRLTEATEGSRELDAEIGAAIRWFSPKAQDWMRNWDIIAPLPKRPGNIACWHSNGEHSVYWEVPRFSTSIDAALTLVPEGWCTSHQQGYDLKWLVDIQKISNWSADNTNGIVMFDVDRMQSLPLALCIAALKARDQS